MEEDYRQKKIRVKLDNDDIKRLMAGETVVGYKVAIQKQDLNKEKEVKNGNRN